MKIKISFRPGEEEDAERVFQAAWCILPSARIHKVTDKAPVTLYYLTTKKP